MKSQESKPNGTKLARLMKEASRKNLFAHIKDPAAWQHEIRKNRPLPGRALVTWNIKDFDWVEGLKVVDP